MSDIRHRIGIEAPQADVHRALATVEGLASWWTTDVEGDPAVGRKLVFTFGDRGSVTMEVLELSEDRIAWRGVTGPDAWIDTTFTFDLAHEDGETVLLFTNAGWREEVPFQGHCTSKWGSFFLGLKAGLEGGKPAPFPTELVIIRWD